MLHRLPSFALAVLLALTNASASARLIDTKNICSSSFYLPNFQPIGTGIIASAGADVFYDKLSCEVAPRCRHERLPPGGHVLLGRHWRNFVCTYFPRHRNSTGGWVKANEVIAQPFHHSLPLRAWLGLWTGDDVPDDGPYVRFLLRKGVLTVKGESWTNPPENHVGALNEAVRHKGYMAHDVECNVAFWLVGRFLVVDDHDNPCGGSGAWFYGVYMRSTKRQN